MIFLVVLLTAICLYKIKFSFSDDIFSDYISAEKCNSIKGVFIILVFISHISRYMTLSETISNSLYINFRSIMGQSVVAMFLFYSGYGMMLSCVKKGQGYVKTIPTKRILKVLLHFDVAVLLFLIIKLLMGNSYSVAKVLLSLIGWESIGNSNWYIFAVLILYFITFLAFIIGKDNKKLVLALAFSLTVIYIIVISIYKQSCWFNTALIYPLGMLWYYYENKITALFNSKKYTYWLTIAISIVIYAVTFMFTGNVIAVIIRNLLFAIVFVLITMRVQINNKILNYFGRNLFSFYILQRIPMIILSYFNINEKPILFIVISAAATIAISYPFNILLKWLDGILFNRKKKLKGTNDTGC
ncbi:MAG: acyltransferase family protein [Eubacterium sp.]